MHIPQIIFFKTYQRRVNKEQNFMRLPQNSKMFPIFEIVKTAKKKE